MPVDGYYIVRQSNAHAWAEYWQPGEGWVRVDPTAAVAPDRIVRSRQPGAAPGLVAGAIGNVSPQLLARLRGGWEAANNRWNQWVLNYSRGQQFDLLESLGVNAPDLARPGLCADRRCCVPAAWPAPPGRLWDRHRQDPWQRLQRRILRARWRSCGVRCSRTTRRARWRTRVRERLGAPGEPLALRAGGAGPRSATRSRGRAARRPRAWWQRALPSWRRRPAGADNPAWLASDLRGSLLALCLHAGAAARRHGAQGQGASARSPPGPQATAAPMPRARTCSDFARRGRRAAPAAARLGAGAAGAGAPPAQRRSG